MKHRRYFVDVAFRSYEYDEAMKLADERTFSQWKTGARSLFEGFLQTIPLVFAEDTPVAPTFAAARECVGGLVEAISYLNNEFDCEVQSSDLQRGFVLANASHAAVFWRHGLEEDARKALVSSWADHALTSAPSSGKMAEISKNLTRTPPAFSEGDREFLVLFNIAVNEKLIADQAAAQGRQWIRQLESNLRFSREDVGGMVGVTARVIKDWEAGTAPIPVDAYEKLRHAHGGLLRLLAIFRPVRLPDVIGREAEIFNGETAREWILQQRIHDVADRYETAYRYQG